MEWTKEEFEAAMSGVRVDLRRELINVDTVSAIKFDDPNQIKNFHCPWYMTKTECDVDYSVEGAVSVTIGDVAANLEAWPRRREAISEIQAEFLSEDEVKFDVVGYALGDERVLLLDGNHRTVGLLRSGVKFSLRVFLIVGPIDPRILPDLEHWN